MTGREDEHIHEVISARRFSGDGPVTRKCEKLLEVRLERLAMMHDNRARSEIAKALRLPRKQADYPAHEVTDRQRIGHADVAFTMKQYVQTDLEADREVANTLAGLIIGGLLVTGIDGQGGEHDGATA